MASAGVAAADLLVEACRSGPDDLRLETVKGLAVDLGRRLSSPVEDGAPDPVIDSALACADLATLAVCNVQGLPEERKPLGAAATRLAAGATHALLELVENGKPNDPHAENISRDARSAGWKADLAVRQLTDMK